MKIIAAATLAVLALSCTNANAGSVHLGKIPTSLLDQATQSQVVEIGGRNNHRRRHGGHRGGGGIPVQVFSLFVGAVADSCDSSGPGQVCELDQFEANCEANGGGLSSEPGGGVECDTSGWPED